MGTTGLYHPAANMLFFSFAVGGTVRLLGKGIDKIFWIIGGTLSLASCLSGNLLAACIFIAKEEQIDLFNMIKSLDLEMALEIFEYSYTTEDYIFYGLAAILGAVFCIIPIRDGKPVYFLESS